VALNALFGRVKGSFDRMRQGEQLGTVTGMTSVLLALIATIVPLATVLMRRSSGEDKGRLGGGGGATSALCVESVVD
jgi:hypothetical protein